MNILKSFGFVLAFALPLLAQQHQLRERQLSHYKGNDDGVRSVINYCNAVDDSVQEQQPRIFAELNIDSKTESKSDRWREFASKDEWEAAGKPVPLAFVWNRDGVIVRVTIVARPPLVRVPVVAHRRVDYCYGTDARLIRIRCGLVCPNVLRVSLPVSAYQRP